VESFTWGIEIRYTKILCSQIQDELTSSTFCAVFADVSINTNPFSLANCSPSSVLTALLWAKSHLLPISMMVMFELACCRASSNQLARWLNVSLLHIPILKSANRHKKNTRSILWSPTHPTARHREKQVSSIFVEIDGNTLLYHTPVVHLQLLYSMIWW